MANESPGATVECGWCGERDRSEGSGPPAPSGVPTACRQRSWESRSAAAKRGEAAVEVRDRYIVTVPTDPEDWFVYLDRLIRQIIITRTTFGGSTSES